MKNGLIAKVLTPKKVESIFQNLKERFPEKSEAWVTGYMQGMLSDLFNLRNRDIMQFTKETEEGYAVGQRFRTGLRRMFNNGVPSITDNMLAGTQDDHTLIR